MKDNEKLEKFDLIPYNVQQINYYTYTHNNTESWSIQKWYGGKEVFLDKDKTNNILNIIANVKQIENKISSKDVIYTSNLSDIPRFKLKEYIKENNIKRTSKIKQSTCIIISKKIFNELIVNFKLNNCTFVNEQFALKINNSITNSNRKLEDQFSEAYDKNQHYYLSEDRSNLEQLKKSKKWGNDYINSSYVLEGCTLNLYRSSKFKDFIKLLFFLLDNPKIKIVFDETLFETLNKEGIELDNDYESTLRDIIFSKDLTNIKLGVEMMSNLVINDLTILKISLLLHEFIQRRRVTDITTYAQSNRNFKTILNIFKSKQIFWNSEWKMFASSLRKNFNQGKEGEAVKVFIINNLNREFNQNGKGFKIEDIKFAAHDWFVSGIDSL